METYAKKDYSIFNVKELISELKDRDISGYGGKPKAILIEMLENDDEKHISKKLSTKKGYKLEKKGSKPVPC